jgi:hypothetical protein
MFEGLIRRDPILAPIIRRFHDRRLIDAPAVDPFSALVRTIVGQQLSTKAAATIHRRLLELLPDYLEPQGRAFGRLMDPATEVMLVHPGGPYWKNKDEGAWSIPKGELVSPFVRDLLTPEHVA